MSKYLDEHQREILAKGFLKAKNKEIFLHRQAKKFATENHYGGKPTSYDIDNHLKACRNLVASANGEVHLAWSKWKGRPPNPKKINYSHDFVVDIMNNIDFKATDKEKQRLAETLISRGGKNFLKAIDKYIADRTFDEINAQREQDFEILKSREKAFADELAKISDLSMIEAEDSFDSWENLLFMKLCFSMHIYEEHKEATGTIKASLKDILNKLEPLQKPIYKLSRHIRVSSLATRILQHWYIEGCFDKLTEDDMNVALGVAYLGNLEKDHDDMVYPTHNSILKGDIEIVFRDKYLDHQILYSHKNKHVKRIREVGEDMWDIAKKEIKKMAKILDGRKISYKWSTFFTNSITIDREWQNTHSLNVIEAEKEQWYSDNDKTTDLYRLITLSSKMAKSLRAKNYKRK